MVKRIVNMCTLYIPALYFVMTIRGNPDDNVVGRIEKLKKYASRGVHLLYKISRNC